MKINLIVANYEGSTEEDEDRTKGETSKRREDKRDGLEEKVGIKGQRKAKGKVSMNWG